MGPRSPTPRSAVVKDPPRIILSEPLVDVAHAVRLAGVPATGDLAVGASRDGEAPRRDRGGVPAAATRTSVLVVADPPAGPRQPPQVPARRSGPAPSRRLTGPRRRAGAPTSPPTPRTLRRRSVRAQRADPRAGTCSSTSRACRTRVAHSYCRGRHLPWSLTRRGRTAAPTPPLTTRGRRTGRRPDPAPAPTSPPVVVSVTRPTAPGDPTRTRGGASRCSSLAAGEPVACARCAGADDAGQAWRRRELITPVSKPARCRPPWNRACSILRQRSMTTLSPAASPSRATSSCRRPSWSHSAAPRRRSPAARRAGRRGRGTRRRGPGTPAGRRGWGRRDGPAPRGARVDEPDLVGRGRQQVGGDEVARPAGLSLAPRWPRSWSGAGSPAAPGPSGPDEGPSPAAAAGRRRRHLGGPARIAADLGLGHPHRPASLVRDVVLLISLLAGLRRGSARWPAPGPGPGPRARRRRPRARR